MVIGRTQEGSGRYIYRVIFFNWYPPKKLKYGKPRLGESMLMSIGLDTPNLA